MALTRPVVALRRFIVLALPMGACVIQNPGFIFETDGATAGTATTDAATTTVANSVGTDDTGSTDAVPTTDGTTSSVVTSTTVSTLPSDTTTGASNTDTTSTDATSMGESTDDSSTGVQPDCMSKQVQDFFAVEDAFFIAGASDNQTKCMYYDAVAGSEHPCRQLNFGTTSALRVARMDGGIDAMYAVRFPSAKLADFVLQGNQIVQVQLVMTVYGTIVAPIEFRVGMITESWMAGGKNGTLAVEADSSFESASIGVQAQAWTGGDGPRGASVEVATLSVPVGFGDHEKIVSTPFDITPWLADPFKAQGLVVSFPKDVAVETYGPGLKALESAPFQPLLRVTYCEP